MTQPTSGPTQWPAGISGRGAPRPGRTWPGTARGRPCRHESTRRPGPAPRFAVT